MSIVIAWMLTAVITGGVTVYTVVPGDTLTIVAARFGAYPTTIAADNQLDPKRPLTVGRQLHIDNRHISSRQGLPVLYSGEFFSLAVHR